MTAEQTVQRRGAHAGAAGTLDDNPFDTLQGLYTVMHMGPESMEGIERFVRLTSPTLNLVNKKSTSANLLVKKVGVDAKTAVNIWRTRKAGPDHVLGTSDDTWMSYRFIFGETNLTDPDDPSKHAHSIDEVPSVGPSTIQRLADYEALHGY